MRLVLDSSVITERDWHLSGPAAQALLAASRRGRLRLVIPELVIREVVNSHRERERALIHKLYDARAKLRKLQGAWSADVPDPNDYPPRNDGYASDLSDQLASARAQTPEIPEVAHEKLVTRALGRRRPFDKRGRAGYRDALIWHTVLEGATRDEQTVLATNNKDDFADEDDPVKPHTHLRDELEARGLDGSSVRICQSLEQAVQLVLEPAKGVIDRLSRRLGEDDDWRNEVGGLMKQAAISEASYADDTGVHIDIQTTGEPFAGDITDAELEDIQHFGSADIRDAYALSETDFIVRLGMSAEAVYRLEVSTVGFSRDPSKVPADLDLSGDEGHAYFSGFADVALHFGARYHANRDEVTEIELSYMTTG